MYSIFFIYFSTWNNLLLVIFTRTQTINKQIYVIKQTFKFSFIKNEVEYK